MSYKEGLDALYCVRDMIASNNFPLVKQRKFNGICNAIAMQIDDGEYSLEVVDHLEQALLALTKVYQLESNAFEDALRDFRRRLGGVSGYQLCEGVVVLGVALDVVVVGELLGDDHVHHRVVEGDVGAWLDAAVVIRLVGEAFAARVDDDELRTVLRRLLEERRGYRMVASGVGSGEQGGAGIDDVAVGRGDGAATDPLEQGGDARGVAQACAVIDVVGAEGCPHQLLEQVGLLDRAFGAAETGQGIGTVGVADPGQPTGDQVEGFLPSRLPKGRHHLLVVNDSAQPSPPVVVTAHLCGERSYGIGLFPPDEGDCQALGVSRVVPAVASFHA